MFRNQRLGSIVYSTNLDFLRYTLPGRQAGIGLVAAISLIVIVSLLTVAITRTVGLGADGVALETLSNKARLAAQSGAQIGLNRVYAPATGGGICSDRTLSLATLPGLQSCTAQVSCTTVTSGAEQYYAVESSGSCTAGSLVTNRLVRVLGAD